MMKTKISVLGTVHSTSKSKSKVNKIINNNKFDAILLEGVKNIKKSYYIKWWSESFLILTLSLYDIILRKKGSEILLAKNIANNLHIPVHHMDMDFDLLMKSYHKWYNFFIFMLFVIILNLILPLKIIGIIPMLLISLLMADLFYFAYFVFKTKRIRDLQFVNSTNKIINDKHYSNILVIFGTQHKKHYKQYFEIIDLT